MKNKIKTLLIILSPCIIQSTLYMFSNFFAYNIHIISSSLDNKIPFVSQFVYFYIFWYLLLFLGSYIIFKYDRDSFKKYFITYVTTSIIGAIIFVIYPTEIIRADVSVHNLSAWIVNLVYYFDTPGLNCFPSFHCLDCFIWLNFITFNKKIDKIIRIFISVFSILIIISTLFIKQHVIWDILGSFLILIFTLIILKIIEK